MKNILITGVAGTGKSTISDALNTQGYHSTDLEAVDDLFAWVDNETKEKVTVTDKNDLEKMAKLKWICNTEMLSQLLLNQATFPIKFYSVLLQTQTRYLICLIKLSSLEFLMKN